MTRLSALADRAALPVMRLAAAAHLVLLALFLASLVLVAGRAHAEAPACTGTNLLDSLAKDDPATLAKIKAEAAATQNGESILWKIEKHGIPASYLYGTMHVTDPRVTVLPDNARKAFDGSNTLVIETTDVLDEKAMLGSIMQTPELMMFTDSTTLTSLLSPEDKKVVDEALTERGIPPYSVSKMKPWVISAMVSLPACELARKAGGAPVLDVKLAEEAKAGGKTIAGLESARDQLEAMASLPLKFHLQGLVDTLKLGNKMDDVIETMVRIYQSGETGLFWPLFHAVLPQEDGGEGYAAFEEKMITSRNKVMADHAAPLLDRGGVFMAVGALHLPGRDGVVSLLNKAGYAVTPVR
jgi:uncharacterized protein YbaP (TraB family)